MNTRFFSARRSIQPAALLVLLAACVLPGSAWAHVGGHGAAHLHFFEGFVHPFTGADHLAAMLAVGAWSAMAVRPAWLAPLAFVALLTLGAFAGMQGWLGSSLAHVEPMIAASLLVLGLLVATRQKLPVVVAAAVAGVFAFFHGAAHGTELGADQAFAALAGMVLGTAMLHLAGMWIGHSVMARHRWVAATAGAGTVALGAALLLRMV